MKLFGRHRVFYITASGCHKRHFDLLCDGQNTSVKSSEGSVFIIYAVFPSAVLFGTGGCHQISHGYFRALSQKCAYGSTIRLSDLMHQPVKTYIRLSLTVIYLMIFFHPPKEIRKILAVLFNRTNTPDLIRLLLKICQPDIQRVFSSLDHLGYDTGSHALKYLLNE